MQIARRPLAPAEPDYELICLVVSLGGTGFAATWLALHLPWPICAFHLITGHPCATCGATRAAIAFFHGAFLQSVTWNPLAFALYVSLSIFDVYAFFVVVRRAPRLRLALSAREKSLIGRTAVALFAANWIYLLFANPSL